MKNSILIALMLCTTISFSQDIKVKGNREPTTEITIVEPFSELEIDGDYEVTILQGAQTQVELTTDSNLHEFITMNRIGDKLTLSTRAKIRSKRTMEFRITYGPELRSITVREDAQLSSVTKLVFQQLNLKVDNDAKVFLTAEVEELVLNAMGSSKSELNLSGNTASINVTQNADIKALITYDTADVLMKDRVDTRIEGDVDQGKVTLSDRATMEAKNLVFKDLELYVNNNATVEVNATKSLRIEAEKDADISVYNSPKIELIKFDGDSVLRKK